VFILLRIVSFPASIAASLRSTKLLSQYVKELFQMAQCANCSMAQLNL